MYINTIPETDIKESNLPIIRFTELDSQNDNYASNIPLTLRSTVQVDVWCKDLAQAESLYLELDKVLTAQGFGLSLSGLDNDPSFNNVPRIYKRYNVQQTIKINSSEELKGD